LVDEVAPLDEPLGESENEPRILSGRRRKTNSLAYATVITTKTMPLTKMSDEFDEVWWIVSPRDKLDELAIQSSVGPVVANPAGCLGQRAIWRPRRSSAGENCSHG
jgi:hypothetical protein